jgi:hypothetical protein
VTKPEPTAFEPILCVGAGIGFFGWTVALTGVLLVVMAACRLVLPADLARYAVPGAVALLLVASFVVRPKETLLVFAAYVLFNETIATYIGDASKRVDELTIPVLFGVAALRSRAWTTHRLTMWREGSLGVALAIGLISSLVHGVPISVWLPALGLLMKGVGVYYVACWIDFTARDVQRYAVALLAVAALVLGLGFVELINPTGFQHALGLPEYAHMRGGIPSVKSLFFHPVLFGWFTTFCALYLVAGYEVYRRSWMLLAGTLLTLGTILSGRRKPLVGLLAAIAGGFVWSMRRGASIAAAARAWVPVGVAGLILLVVFLPTLATLYGVTIDRYLTTEPPVTEHGANGGGVDAGSGTLTPARIALYVGSLRIARDDFPFGAGLGRYGSWMSRVQYSPLYQQYGLSHIRGLRPRNPQAATDTFWPMILGELGVFGFVAYLVFVGNIALRVWWSGMKTGPPIIVAFRFGTLLILIEAFVESLAAPNLIAPPVAYFVFGTAGMVAALDRLDGVEEAPERRASRNQG